MIALWRYLLKSSASRLAVTGASQSWNYPPPPASLGCETQRQACTRRGLGGPGTGCYARIRKWRLCGPLLDHRPSPASQNHRQTSCYFKRANPWIRRPVLPFPARAANVDLSRECASGGRGGVQRTRLDPNSPLPPADEVATRRQDLNAAYRARRHRRSTSVAVPASVRFGWSGQAGTVRR